MLHGVMDQRSWFSINDQIRKAAHSHQFVLIVGHLDIPHMSGPPLMKEPTRGFDHSRSYTFDVVRIHLDPHDRLLFGVDQQITARTAKRFGQGYRGPSVKRTHGLMRPGFYSHGGCNRTWCTLNQFNSQGLHQRPFEKGVADSDLFRGQHVRAKVPRFSSPGRPGCAIFAVHK